VIADVATGFRQFPHGGMAVGGVLFGEGDRHLVRVLATRPMPCEHSAGPSFTLSENDHADLESVLSAAREDPEIAGMIPVGWFHSHTRSGLTLTPSDLVIHERHFPEAWQIAMVVRPEDDGPTQAAIFVRQDDGNFPVQPTLELEDLSSCISESVQIALPLDDVQTEPEAEPTSAVESPSRQDAAPVAAAPAAEAPEESVPVEAPNLFSGFSEAPGETKEKKSGRWIGVAAAVALAVGGLWAAGQVLTPPEYWEAVEYYKTSSTEYLASVVDYWERRAAASSEPRLSVRAIGSGPNLLIRWDSTSPALTAATGGVLEIDDGVQVEQVPLDLAMLVEGSHSYLRTSAELGVKLTVFGESGASLHESTRFLGGSVRTSTPDAINEDTPETLRSDLESLRSAIALQSEQSANLRATLNTFQQLRASRTAAASPPAPVRPQASLAQPPPARPAPPVLQQRPANLPVPSTISPSPVAAKPAYRGPKSGRLIWTGFLASGQALVIGSSSVSVGSLSGRFPGVPVEVSVSPGELTGGGLTVYSGNTRYQNSPATEEPNQGNAWNKTTIRYDSARAQAASVVERPAAANDWKRLSVRANGRPLSVLVVSWSVIE
jgi:proteasome lid subunit RPN8/RPN11